MGFKVYLFDFDGTVADTFDAAFEIWNILAKEFNFQQITQDKVELARDMTTRQLMKAVGVSTIRLPLIAQRAKKELRHRIHDIQPITGMSAVLRTLKERGVRLGLLTSNSSENVRIFCKSHELEIFEFVRTSSRLLGKAREMKSFLRKNKFLANEVLYVGDETRDLEAAKEAGIPVAAVTWGYNSRKALYGQKPDYMVEHPEELLGLID